MIVVLDACVLYPPSLRDLLLTLGALDAFDIRWSEEILEEVSRNVLEDNPGSDPTRFAGHTLAFPEAMTPVNHEIIESLDNDPKDRHVAAVAITSQADAIITLNVKDFRGAVLRRAGIAVLTPGMVLGRVLDENPEVVALAVRHLSSRWVDPPRSAREITRDLSVLPTLAPPMRRLRTLLDKP